MTSPSPARVLAFKTLLAVEKEGAFASLYLQKAKLAERELRLATELVYGTLRERSLLDWWLKRGTGKEPGKQSASVLTILRLALYQCAFSSSIPKHAAVDQAVLLAKKFVPKAAGFVNWALRAVLRKKDPFALPEDDGSSDYLATRFSHPRWLVDLWLEQLGLDKTRKLLEANQQPSPLSIRANTLRTDARKLREALEKEGVQSVAGRLPEALRIKSGRPAGTPAFREGLFLIQSEASMLAAHILAPKAGQRVLDLAAAPGSKITHLAELMENQGEILACDLYQQRLKLVEENCQRLGIKIVKTLCADGRQIREHVQEEFHKVLLDAPCSGLGVMRGKPDLRWHKSPSELEKLPSLQLELLAAAASVLAPGGELCYSTCTINRAENQQVVEAFLAAHPNFQLEPPGERVPVADLPKTSTLQLLPSEDDLDGFFFALLKRVS